MKDQSFQTLVISLIIHIILAWILVHHSFPSGLKNQNLPIEITLQESPHKNKKSMVTETDLHEKPEFREAKDEAEIFSQFTKRVKKQTQARLAGPTKNRLGQDPSDSDEARFQGKDGSSMQNRLENPTTKTTTKNLILPKGLGPGQRSNSGTSSFGKQIIVGKSTSREYLPGILDGEFTALNTDRFTYYTFFARINDQIYIRWVNNLRVMEQTLPPATLKELSSQERRTQVDVQLNAKGEFMRASIYHSSGFTVLDETITHAFRDAAPFQNPPQELLDEDGFIHLYYNFTVH